MIEFRKISDFFYPIDFNTDILSAKKVRDVDPGAILKQYQANRLVDLLRHCAIQVPFYRQYFLNHDLDANRFIQNNAFQFLQKLAILNKDTLREAPEMFLAGDMAQRCQTKSCFDFRDNRNTFDGVLGPGFKCHGVL